MLIKERRLLQPAVVAINANDPVIHIEYVADQMHEPDSETAIDAINRAAHTSTLSEAELNAASHRHRYRKHPRAVSLFPPERSIPLAGVSIPRLRPGTGKERDYSTLAPAVGRDKGGCYSAQNSGPIPTS